MIALAEDKKDEFEHLPLQDEGRGYTRMQATNPHTGERQDVILLPPEKFADMRSLLSDSHIELRTDINRAFEGFTKVQRRVLHNVLIRGMSVEIATARMSKSSRWWRRWLTDEALPALRAKLADYMEPTKRFRVTEYEKDCGLEPRTKVLVTR